MHTVIIFLYYEKLSYIMQLEPVRRSLLMQRPCKTVRRFGLQQGRLCPEPTCPSFAVVTFHCSLRPMDEVPLSPLPPQGYSFSSGNKLCLLGLLPPLRQVVQLWCPLPWGALKDLRKHLVLGLASHTNSFLATWYSCLKRAVLLVFLTASLTIIFDFLLIHKKLF